MLRTTSVFIFIIFMLRAMSVIAVIICVLRTKPSHIYNFIINNNNNRSSNSLIKNNVSSIYKMLQSEQQYEVAFKSLD